MVTVKIADSMLTFILHDGCNIEPAKRIPSAMLLSSTQRQSRKQNLPKVLRLGAAVPQSVVLTNQHPAEAFPFVTHHLKQVRLFPDVIRLTSEPNVIGSNQDLFLIVKG